MQGLDIMNTNNLPIASYLLLARPNLHKKPINLMQKEGMARGVLGTTGSRDSVGLSYSIGTKSSVAS